MWADDDEETPLVKRLRAEIEKRDASLKELDGTLAERNEELKKLRPQVRLTSVRDVLSDLGVPAKVAKLIPQDVEASKDAVSAWLDEYGDVLGIQKTDTSATNSTATQAGHQAQVETGAPEVTVSQETANQWERVQSQESSAGATTPDKEARDLAALTSAYKAALEGGGSDAFFAYLQSGQTP
jgi:hypothetical protein